MPNIVVGYDGPARSRLSWPARLCGPAPGRNLHQDRSLRELPSRHHPARQLTSRERGDLPSRAGARRTAEV